MSLSTSLPLKQSQEGRDYLAAMAAAANYAWVLFPKRAL